MLELDDFDDEEVITLWCALYESSEAIVSEFGAEATLATRDMIGVEMYQRGITPAEVEVVQDNMDTTDGISV